MPKIQLGSPPATFPRKVEFELVQGTVADINVSFRYRTRTEFAEFIADLYPNLKGGTALQVGPGVDVVAQAEDGVRADVKHILGAVVSWDLEEEINAVSVRQLVDEYPAAAAALMDSYRIAITEGRRKN